MDGAEVAERPGALTGDVLRRAVLESGDRSVQITGGEVHHPDRVVSDRQQLRHPGALCYSQRLNRELKRQGVLLAPQERTGPPDMHLAERMGVLELPGEIRCFIKGSRLQRVVAAPAADRFKQHHRFEALTGTARPAGPETSSLGFIQRTGLQRGLCSLEEPAGCPVRFLRPGPVLSQAELILVTPHRAL